MTDTTESLLRELAEIHGERPYQARDLRGPFDCVFCGGTTEDESHPVHEPHCPWPRILKFIQ